MNAPTNDAISSMSTAADASTPDPSSDADRSLPPPGPSLLRPTVELVLDKPVMDHRDKPVLRFRHDDTASPTWWGPGKDDEGRDNGTFVIRRARKQWSKIDGAHVDVIDTWIVPASRCYLRVIGEPVDKPRVVAGPSVGGLIVGVR